MRRFAVPLLGGLLFLALASPAWAQEATPSTQDVVVLTGRAVVAEGDTVRTVVVFHGSVVISGTVTKDVVAFDAPVTIFGRVDGNVTVLNGRVLIAESAHVEGDVIARTEPVVAPGATWNGRYRHFDAGQFNRTFSVLGRFAVWLAVSVSVLVLGMLVLWLAPRAVPATLEAVRTAAGPAVGWGFVVFFGVPTAAIIAVVTLVGIPLGVGVLLSVALLDSLGYVASGWLLGSVLVRPPASRFLAFLVGWAILRLVALVPALGLATWVAGSLFGLGVITVAVWRARTPKPALAAGPMVPPAPAAPSPPPA